MWASVTIKILMKCVIIFEGHSRVVYVYMFKQECLLQWKKQIFCHVFEPPEESKDLIETIVNVLMQFVNIV